MRTWNVLHIKMEHLRRELKGKLVPLHEEDEEDKELEELEMAKIEREESSEEEEETRCPTPPVKNKAAQSKRILPKRLVIAVASPNLAGPSRPSTLDAAKGVESKPPKKGSSSDEGRGTDVDDPPSPVDLPPARTRLEMRQIGEKKEEEDWGDKEASHPPAVDENKPATPPASEEPDFGRVPFFPQVLPRKERRAERTRSHARKTKKRTVNNGFFQFMQERRRQLEANGRKFMGGWREVSNAVGPEWTRLADDKKEMYQDMSGNEWVKNSSKKDKQGKFNLGITTSIGKKYYEIVEEQKREQLEDMQNRLDASELLVENPTEAVIILIDVQLYLDAWGLFYLPAELALTAFSIKDGIVGNYWSLIDPYKVPGGYADLARGASERISLPYPCYSNYYQDYGKIISGMEQFIKQHTNAKTGKALVYCLESNIKPFTAALTWLYAQCDMTLHLQLQKLEHLLITLSGMAMKTGAKLEGVSSSYRAVKYFNFNSLYGVSSNIPQKGDLVRSLSSGFSSGYQSASGGSSGLERVINNQLLGKKGDFFALFRHPMFYLANTSGYHNATAVLQHAKWNPRRALFFKRDAADLVYNSTDLACEGSIGCPIHEKENDCESCCLNVVNRIAFRVIEAVSEHFGVEVVPGVQAFELAEDERKKRDAFLSQWHQGTEFLELSHDGSPPPKFKEIFGFGGPGRPE